MQEANRWVDDRERFARTAASELLAQVQRRTPPRHGTATKM
jgi:hypothetical protein